MRSREAREKFNLADQLFRDNKYAEALTILDELDSAFPDSKNVLYPKAMCLGKLGRYQEALDICKQLKIEFSDPRAERMMQKIDALRRAREADAKAKEESKQGKKNLEFSPSFDPNALTRQMNPAETSQAGMAFDEDMPKLDDSALEDLFTVKPAAPPPPPPEPPKRTKLYIGIGVGAVVLLLLALVPLMLQKEKPAEHAAAPASDPAAATPAELAPPKPIVWYDDWDQGTEVAYDGGTPVLWYFRSADCPDCERIDADLWTEESTMRLVEGWTCIRVDLDNEDDAVFFSEEYGVDGAPTVLVEDEYYGNSVFQRQGYVSPHDFYDAIAPLDLKPYTGEDDDFGLDIPAGVIALGLVAWPFMLFVSLYCTCAFTKKLPHDDLVPDLTSIGLVSLFLAIVSPTACVGLFIWYHVLRNAYEFELGEFVVFGVLVSATVVILNVVTYPFLDAPLWVYILAARMYFFGMFFG